MRAGIAESEYSDRVTRVQEETGAAQGAPGAGDRVHVGPPRCRRGDFEQDVIVTPAGCEVIVEAPAGWWS